MSTLPGLASKGEKGKSKFQSLDINSLYRSSRGESSEKQQQKSTVPLKHGMQTLGRVPNARRIPVNLPSLKSEHSGVDTAVSLVPPGGPGWGKQDATSTTTTTPSSTSTVTNSSATSPSTASAPLSAHQAAIALPVTTAIPPNSKHTTPAATPATSDKSWSSIMTGQDALHPPPYQSPQFQYEFPSLSAGDGGITHTGSDIQYGPGPSLRPQTEGSWTQGGSRPPPVDGPPRSSSAPLGAPPQLPAQVGQQPLPPQFRSVMPPFMYRNSYPAGGHPPPNAASPMNGRNRADNRPPSRHVEPDEVAHRPIIKEEDLSRMDDISRDAGWATHDDIDYNQKLAFSDDESAPEKDSRKDGRRNASQNKEQDKTESYSQDGHSGSWGGPRHAPRGRSNDEDDIWVQRRRQQHSAELAIAVERAKQRKEEEEKRFRETKMNAAKKLKELDEKSKKSKSDKDMDESVGTINPSVVPPQPITPAPIPVPDWERERDNRNDPAEEKNFTREPASDFKQLTQIEGKNFGRKDVVRGNERSQRERDSREQNGPSYQRHFQVDLPPRFQKQFKGGNAAPGNQSYQQYDTNRWMQSSHPSHKPSTGNAPRNMEEKEDERKDYRRQSSDESFHGSHRNYADSSRKSSDSRYSEDREYRSMDYDYKKDKEDGRWEKDRKEDDKFDEQSSTTDWHSDRRREERDRFERPQRPDSRDSRASRESRHSRESEPRDYHDHITWADTPYELAYEEKKRDVYKEERGGGRPVPGPITKDRIEADDLKNEKRGFAQLKRGQMPEKKISDGRKEESSKEVDDSWNIKRGKENTPENNAPNKPWSDSSAPVSENISDKFMEALEKPAKESIKEEAKPESVDEKKPTSDVSKDHKRGPRMRFDQQGGRSQGWGGNTGYTTYHRSTWSKKPPRNVRGPPRGGKTGDWIGTDSEGSLDEMSVSTESGKDERNIQKSPRPGKKFDKDEKNEKMKGDKQKMDSKRDNYVPRGEPSRHGRGGYGNVKRGVMSKRIDGYGPPPSKSPFGHPEEKEKKASGDETSNDLAGADDKMKHASATRKDSGQINRSEEKFDRNRSRKLSSETRRFKPKEGCDSNSENSDEGDRKDSKGNKKGSGRQPPSNRSGSSRRNFNPSRLEKRGGYGSSKNESLPPRQSSSTSLRGSLKDEKSDVPSSETVPKTNEAVEGEVEDKSSAQGDSDGFQEVKSKKTGKERQKSVEDKPTNGNAKPIKPEKEQLKTDRKPPKNSNTAQLTQQQISNIPPLMATPVNPPAVLPQPFNKGPRINKLPPRLAKQKENNRLQKIQNTCDPDLNKVNQSMGMYPNIPVSVPMSNAWDKPLTPQLRGAMDQDNVLGVGIENCKSLEQARPPSQTNSPGNDKIIGKGSQLQEKAVLDGTTPPVNTIIFENTNFKSAPGPRSSRANEKARPKLDDDLENSVIPGFSKPITELLNKSDSKQEALQIQLTFNSKEDNAADMKLDFFESEISHLTEEKGSKNLGLPRSMHTVNANSTISASTADALNIKIQSVKKVWETMPTVIEHGVGGQEDANASFSSTFGPDPNSLDPSGAFGKGADTPDDTHEAYSPSPNQVAAANSTTNVCKVKPTQQVPGNGGQAVLNAASHQQHSGVVTQGLINHQISPPPMQPVIGAGVGLGQPPQQYTANQHIGYQPSLGGNTQYGVSAIPSPPTVLFNSTQQIQAQTGLYGHFSIDQAGVIGSQGRSQYSQYPYNLGQTGSSHYSAQSMYLQTAQPHAPPAAQAPPDLYSNMNSYRLSATAPFGQNQQLNNPTTVLISSTSNSLMSATVKPSSQPISAIGTKAGGVGQAYQQQSQQGQQLYMYDPSIQANYLPSTGVLQRGPTGPVQNSVVPAALQPSSSYYSGSTGGQTGYFQQPGNSSLSSAQLPQHQAGYGLQGTVFGSHSQSHNSPSLQGYNNHFLSAPIQIAAAAAALSAQQYRSQSLPGAAYLKGVANQGINEQAARPQQLKSPGSQQEVLSSVFNSSPQIPSPKSRQNCKQPPPQPSPNSQKYNFYQGVANQQGGQTQRYNTPIQRPVNFSPALGSMQNTGSSNNQKHRSNNTASNKAPTRQYYTAQGTNLTQNEKNDDVKLVGSSSPTTVTSTIATSTSIQTKTSISSVSTAIVNQTQEISKENIVKEEAIAMKD